MANIAFFRVSTKAIVRLPEGDGVLLRTLNGLLSKDVERRGAVAFCDEELLRRLRAGDILDLNCKTTFLLISDVTTHSLYT